LSEQLAAAKAAAKKGETARNDEAEKGRRVEVELGRLKQASAELSGKLTEAEQLAVRSRQRGEEVERRLAESAVELQRVKATAERVEASSREQTSGFARAKEELAALQRARDQLNARLAEGATEVQRVKAELEKQAAERGSAERELREQLQTAKAVAERAGQSEELEDRLRESATKLEELKAESDKRLAESASVESRLAKQLEAAHAAAVRAQAAHQKEAERGSRVEDELASLRVARTTLKGQLLDEKMAAAKAQRHVKQLEERVSRSAADLKLAKANPARKASRRTGRGRSGEAQPADLSRMDLRVRDGISALARATADLEKERRRLESAVLPSDNLMQSIRRLLELPLDAQQKKLVESTLESALQVQASLH
jgi:chromosome segregation ATPase